jgi:hypothetical protein
MSFQRALFCGYSSVQCTIRGFEKWPNIDLAFLGICAFVFLKLLETGFFFAGMIGRVVARGLGL